MVDWPSEWRSQSWTWLGGKNGDEGESNSSTLRNVGLIIAGFVALIFAFWRSVVADKQARASELQASTAERSLLNERYQKGAEMLGHAVLSVRLGGIYALELLAREYPRDYHIQIMELLCAFVRNPIVDTATAYSREEGSSRSQSTLRLRDDVQAAMEIIGRRLDHQLTIEKEKGFRIDLNGAQLSHLSLESPNLSEALLRKANLTFAGIVGKESTALLRRVDFQDADLSGAHIWFADLTESNFAGADLSDLSLVGTNLSSVDFAGPRFGGRPADGFTQSQLEFSSADLASPPRLEGVIDAETKLQLVWKATEASNSEEL